MALGRFFLYIGQVHFVFGQVKFEDHLPGGRQFQNLNVEACPWIHHLGNTISNRPYDYGPVTVIQLKTSSLSDSVSDSE